MEGSRYHPDRGYASTGALCLGEASKETAAAGLRLRSASLALESLRLRGNGPIVQEDREELMGAIQQLDRTLQKSVKEMGRDGMGRRKAAVTAGHPSAIPMAVSGTKESQRKDKVGCLHAVTLLGFPSSVSMCKVYKEGNVDSEWPPLIFTNILL